jgi:hypothetical protein
MTTVGKRRRRQWMAAIGERWRGERMTAVEYCRVL